MRKTILVLLLILSLTTQSFAGIKVDVEVDEKTEVKVIIESNYEKEPIAIEVYDDDRRYYINQDVTYSDGSTEFYFKLEEDKEYDGKVNIKGRQKKFSISTWENLEETTAYVYIKGYEDVILSKTEAEFEEGDTIIDVLERVLEDEDIQYKIENGYVKSIDGQAEFDKGAKSGWMFSINNEFPEIGAANIEVEHGDDIKWLYTIDLGQDIGAIYNVIPYAEDVLEEALENARKILASSKASEEDIIKALNEIIKILEDNFLDIKKEYDAEILIDYVGETLEIIEDIGEKIESQEYREATIDILESLLDVIWESLDMIEEEKIKNEIKGDASIILSILLKITDEIEDMKELEAPFNKAIRTLAKVINKLGEEKRLYIKIPIEDKDRTELNLPPGILNDLFKDGIEIIEIRTKTASFSIEPNTFDKKIRDKEIILNVNRVNEKENTSQDSIIVNLELMVDGEKIDNLYRPMEVDVPLRDNEGICENVQIFLLENNEVREAIAANYDPQTKSVKFSTSKLGKYIVSIARKEFIDLKEYSWAKEAIETMVEKGIVNGRTDTEFDPDAKITRAEFAALIIRMLEHDIHNNAGVSFEDVDESSWYYRFVVAAWEKGLIDGRTEKKFDPQGNITRQEIAKIIAKVLENKSFSANQTMELYSFKDKDDIAVWAKDAAVLTVEKGIITGMDDGRFAPEEEANRAQAVVILYRLYNLIKDKIE